MDLQLLFSKSEQFETEEARADVYPMVRNWIQTHRGLDIESIRGVATLLIVWNAGYYNRAGRGFSAAVETLEELFRNSLFQKLLPSLNGFEIVSADLASLKETVVSLYDCVDSHDGLGIAATGKVLHLLQPDLLVMWDDRICSHYHKGHRNRGLWHLRGAGECYCEFLREMQVEAQHLVSQLSKQQIEKRLREVAGYPKTLAKALDEVNYMLFTISSDYHA